MKQIAIFLILFWVLIIVFPEFLSLLVWSAFVFFGINILFIWFKFWKNTPANNEKCVKFGKYKIYR